MSSPLSCKLALLTTLTALSAISTPASAGTTYRTASIQKRSMFKAVVGDLDKADAKIDGWTLMPDGHWIVVSGRTMRLSSTRNLSFVADISRRITQGDRLTGLDCRSDYGCIATTEKGNVLSAGSVPAAAVRAKVTSWRAKGVDVTDVALSKTGWVLLGTKGYASYSSSVPQGLRDAIFDRRASGRTIQDVAIGHADEWALVADGVVMSDGITSTYRSDLDSRVQRGLRPDQLLIGTGHAYLSYNQDDAPYSPDLTNVLDRMEHNLGASGDNLLARMNTANIPGVSIAVVRGNQVVAARGYGVKEAGKQGPILARTPFDVASMSKYVGSLTALAVLDDVSGVDIEDDAVGAASAADPGGTVESWADANDAETGSIPWQANTIPSSGLPFENLLSNSAHMRASGSNSVRVSLQNSAGNKPKLDFLRGWTCGSSRCSWTADNPTDVTDSNAVFYDPHNDANTRHLGGVGSAYRYAGGGFLVAEAALEDIMDDDIADLVQDYIFDPAGLTDSTAEYPVPSSVLAERAKQHGPAGVARQNAYPWIFAGGMNMTARDYAELLVLSTNRGVASDGTRVLSTASADRLQASVIGRGANRGYSYGRELYGLDGTGRITANGSFSHGGSHGSRTRTFMCGNPSENEGLVILLNRGDGNAVDANGNTVLNAAGNPVPDSAGDTLITDIVAQYNAAVGWTTNCQGT